MRNVFIVNTASKTGKAKEIWKEVENYLNREFVKYEVHFTEGPMDATRFAQEETSKGDRVLLFVMGGDGTLNEALNGIKDFEKTDYCPLPSGSANDFVRGIGMKGNALDILRRALSDESVKRLDIGEVICGGASRKFGVSAGVGVDAYVCLQALDSKLKKFLNKIHMGKATYGLLTVGDIFSMPLSNAKIETESKQYTMKNVIFGAAMNCPAEGGGIPMVPYATADSGRLDAFVAHDIKRIHCLALLPFLVAGKHEKKKGFDFIDFSDMTISLEKPMCVHADGEHVGFFDKVEFKCIPGVLRVRGL